MLVGLVQAARMGRMSSAFHVWIRRFLYCNANAVNTRRLAISEEVRKMAILLRKVA